MEDRQASAWDNLRSWAALGLAVVSVLDVLAERRSRVVFRAKHPTHKIVCECGCWAPGDTSGDVETFEERENCGSLDGTSCRTSDDREGKLQGCKKTSVPTSLIPERVSISGVGPVIEG
jgi:hypothetical protein